MKKIIMDRSDIARDNGEALYDFLLNHNLQHDYFFMISSKSPDWERLQKKGFQLMDFDKISNKLSLVLKKNLLISSHADYHQIGIPHLNRILKNNTRFQKIFLQHGVIYRDLKWHLSKKHKKIDLFITSTQLESNFIKQDYGYEKEVKLTGLARWDALKDNGQDYIVIMPTWDQQFEKKTWRLKREVDLKQFAKSQFFQKWIEVIKAIGQDKKLIFVLHPRLAKTKSLWQNENIKVHQISDFTNISELVNNAELLVTDYSSIMFDFAYLNKKVINYIDGQVRENSYWDWTDNELGFNVYNLEQLLLEIKNPHNQVYPYFKYQDQNNCARIYKEIEAFCHEKN